MMSVKKHKLEWGLSLLSKYDSIVIEDQLKNLHLTKTQVLFLIHLKQKDGIHQDYLTKMFKMNRSTVTRAIKVLVDLGYVIKKTDDTNRKANFVYITPLGQEAFEEVCTALNNWIEIITDGFSEEEIEASINLIIRMASNACKHQGDDYLSNIIKK